MDVPENAEKKPAPGHDSVEVFCEFRLKVHATGIKALALSVAVRACDQNRLSAEPAQREQRGLTARIALDFDGLPERQ
ncbi:MULTISPECIES: hypothetical protein [Paraburkholderia]|uniref:hypothetical protein n=1 Tax=Paraburkholderia TaxID=1822464 RepID=UPI00190AF00F|nr:MULTISPECIES: hypothetical protein [Paraburkholderia]MBK3843829.1 hypothetical protein [Paraburkholderia aspalathi]MBK5185212.1 hypothetical protein [Burkholderia sp. R-69749]MCI0151673.1 hypothetical protein [Paraburkholderia sediminicola]